MQLEEESGARAQVEGTLKRTKKVLSAQLAKANAGLAAAEESVAEYKHVLEAKVVCDTVCLPCIEEYTLGVCRMDWWPRPTRRRNKKWLFFARN